MAYTTYHVPDAVQRPSRCSAKPGPTPLLRNHGPRISSASRRRAARCAASGARERCLVADTRSRPRDAKRPSRCIYLPPLEGVGNAGCPLHPRPRVHLVVVERTRVTTSTPESPDVPARNGFTAYFVLSPVTGLFCHRRLRICFV